MGELRLIASPLTQMKGMHFLGRRNVIVGSNCPRFMGIMAGIQGFNGIG
jgi:hypothetical protein